MTIQLAHFTNTLESSLPLRDKFIAVPSCISREEGPFIVFPKRKELPHFFARTSKDLFARAARLGKDVPSLCHISDTTKIHPVWVCETSTQDKIGDIYFCDADVHLFLLSELKHAQSKEIREAYPQLSLDPRATAFSFCLLDPLGHGLVLDPDAPMLILRQTTPTAYKEIYKTPSRPFTPAFNHKKWASIKTCS